jgi:hypothetical protein
MNLASLHLAIGAVFHWPDYISTDELIETVFSNLTVFPSFSAMKPSDIHRLINRFLLMLQPFGNMLKYNKQFF